MTALTLGKLPQLSAAGAQDFIARAIRQAQWMRQQPGHRVEDEPIVYLQGTPGSGKTALVRQAAVANGFSLYTVIGAAKQPEDIGGIPIVDFKRFETRISEPDVIASVRRLRASTGKPVILFGDEASRIPEASQAAWMSFLQFREIHGYALPDDTVLMLAGNGGADDRGVAGLLAPVVNRVRMIELTPDPKEWARTYAVDAGLHPLVTATVANWPSTANEGSPFHFDPRAGAAPFGSPRSWEAAARAIDFALEEGEDIENSPMLTAELAACVGATCAAALLANAAYFSQLIPADVILKDPHTPPLHDQPTLACMQLLSLASSVTTVTGVNNAIAYAKRSEGRASVPKWTPLLPMFGVALARGTKRHLSGNNQLFDRKKCSLMQFYQDYVQKTAAKAEDLFA